MDQSLRSCKKFVHLDLKGAPPRIGYLIEVQLILLSYDCLNQALMS